MDEIQALPDVDLSPIMDQLKDDGEPQKQQQQSPKADDKQKASDEPLDLGQFKNPKDLLKSYKEIQAAFTRMTQENKSSKEELAALKEQLELARYSVPNPVLQQQQNGAEDNPYKTFNVMRIAEILEEEADKNRAEFQDRYAYAQIVSREYPQLAQTPKGVKKLFEMGDKLRADYLKKNAGKALESIFGEPLGEEEISRLKTLVKGDKSQAQTQTKQNMNAYMPDTSTSTRAGTADQSQTPKYESQIRDGVEKGDLDGVIAAVFGKHLAE